MCGLYALGVRNIQFLFKFLQRGDQRRFSCLGFLIVNFPQESVGQTLATGALREFVTREAFDIRRGVRKLRGPKESLTRAAMVRKFVAKENCKAALEEGTLGIVPDPAFQEVASELEILALVSKAKRLAGLRGVPKCCGAGIPGHVPGRHIPVERRPWLKSSYRVEEPCHAAPLGALPGIVGLDPEIRGNRGAKTA